MVDQVVKIDARQNVLVRRVQTVNAIMLQAIPKIIAPSMMTPRRLEGTASMNPDAIRPQRIVPNVIPASIHRVRAAERKKSAHKVRWKRGLITRRKDAAPRLAATTPMYIAGNSLMCKVSV
ncbi:hypothetical protein [Paraburkholderia metrosideri]|uniref:hypothetical protein n=1 Tax=Paraburkholderia metrosideri TaxID=580937 RepID=UPI00191A037F|nr:hypothetical protein [Paraburkholderia metrosideri]